MTIRRREFIGATLAMGIAAAQEEGGRKAEGPPTRKAKVEKLYKAPDAHPNALEATADGLWIGDQVSERVFQVDWKTGKVLYELQTESHNTSGIAVGGGYLWLGANGDVSGRRPPRSTDKPYGELLQADLKTGKTIKAYRPPWGGGMHGVTYLPQTQTLWVTALSLNALSELDPKNFQILRQIPLRHGRAHGVDGDKSAIWCLFAGERSVHKLNPDTGKVLEIIEITEQDPDPHGMCIHEGYMYYCDAGLTATFPGSAPGYVCRFKV
jgi:streptogramin lyase